MRKLVASRDARGSIGTGSGADLPLRWRTPRDRLARCGLLTAGLCAVTLALAIPSLCASSASAIVVHLKNGKTLSYEAAPGVGAGNLLTPADLSFHNLDYNGGPVMPANTNYALYWDPPEAPAYPSDYQPGIDRYFEDLAAESGGHNNTDSVSAQYNDAAGEFASYESHFGGALLDTDPYPANGCTQAAICLTDKQLRSELAKYVEANGLPVGLTHEYFILTPPGVESCFEAAGNSCSAGSAHPEYCSYHGYVPLSGAGVIVYADDPYLNATICDDGNHPNGTTSDATISGGLSHEHNESLTDPEPNTGWTDFATGQTTGYEEGDKCRTFEEGTEFGIPLGLAANGAKYNQVINGDPYWYQQEWSNEGHLCLQRLTLGGSLPTASFTSKTRETEVTFDASASTALGGVAAYDWEFNDPRGSLPVETTGPTISHKFSEPGTYTVALTVYALNGASTGTARTVVISSEPAPDVTKVAPTRGSAEGGTSVTISGTNFSEASAVSFGSIPAESFTVNSPTKISAVSPAAAVGTVDVTVTTPAGTSEAGLEDRFKFAPAVTAVIPKKGPHAGGTSVTITGAGFEGGAGTMFKFGTAHASEVECSSSTSCTAVTPEHAIGTVDVKATVNRISSAKNAPADEFTYK